MDRDLHAYFQSRIYSSRLCPEMYDVEQVLNDNKQTIVKAVNDGEKRILLDIPQKSPLHKSAMGQCSTSETKNLLKRARQYHPKFKHFGLVFGHGARANLELEFHTADQ